MNNQFDSLISKYAARPDFPPHYLKGMIEVESSFRSDRKGPQNESGLLQFLPSTAKDRGYTPDQLTDPETAIKAGAAYMGWILDKFVNPHIKVAIDPKLRVMLGQFGYNAGIAFAQALAKNYGSNSAILGDPSNFANMVESLRGSAIAAKLAKITGEADFLGARRNVVNKYQAAAAKYAGDFGGAGFTSASMGTLPLAVGGIALAGGFAWWWKNRKG